ncbi:hypothetical protein CTI12_AA464600 [Artemisia annua]|uniref:Uncharacterized protein n=1 Tax=Artemisia annua TaxID=35608 RepID=A0A2U1LQI2_ARTAN|nr:hypothetical protein CTI12_AA464600 [Artemisia annua]
MSSTAFEKITYTTAVEVLNKVTDKTFETKVQWGVALNEQRERSDPNEHFLNINTGWLKVKRAKNEGHGWHNAFNVGQGSQAPESSDKTNNEESFSQRDLPLGIGAALSICCMLYMLVSAVIIGLVPYYAMDPDILSLLHLQVMVFNGHEYNKHDKEPSKYLNNEVELNQRQGHHAHAMLAMNNFLVLRCLTICNGSNGTAKCYLSGVALGLIVVMGIDVLRIGFILDGCRLVRWNGSMFHGSYGDAGSVQWCLIGAMLVDDYFHKVDVSSGGVMWEQAVTGDNGVAGGGGHKR